MSSADLATVVIACPNCGTRYQVPYGTLGPAGREVQCAQCGKAWHATATPPPPVTIVPAPAPQPQTPATTLAARAAPADPDRLFNPAEEAALDAAFEAEARAASPETPAAEEKAADASLVEEARATIAPKRKDSLDPALVKAKQAFKRRQIDIRERLPFARFRRGARSAGLLILVALIVLGLGFRVQLVTWFPSLAGLYATIGLPVNVIGLEFTDAKTLKSLRQGKTVMQIAAKIRSVASARVAVPPVLVSLLNKDGATVYEWTAAPQAADMEPGEILDFSTEVNSPPDTAVRVRLSFTTPRGGAAASQVP